MVNEKTIGNLSRNFVIPVGTQVVRNLNEEIGLPFIDDLISAKTTEKTEMENLDWNFHAEELDQLNK